MTEKTFSGNEVQLVVFKLDGEEYGISILQVQEIKRITQITRVPHTPDYIMGVLNLRGSVVPVIDLKKRLNLPKKEQKYTDDTRIVFVRIDEITVGIVVDAVSEVAAIGRDTIDATDKIIGGTDESSYISGVAKSGDRLLILLDIETILGLSSEIAGIAIN